MTISQCLSSLSKGFWYVMMGKTSYRKRVGADSFKKTKNSEESRVKGKQVRILYDLVTVIRERDFCNRSLMEGCNLQRFQNCEFRIGEDWLLHWEDEELRIDLSARKPANCLVQGTFPDHE